MSSAATPLNRPATLTDLLALPEEGRGWELINGELVEKEAGAHHGCAQVQLALTIGPFGRRRRGGSGPGGWWILSEQLVQFGPSALRPDLAGWLRERLPRLPVLQQDGVIELRPDWVCEIISPGHAADDLVRKKRLYHHHQVPHYWIIDPRDSTLTVHRWSEPGYTQVLLGQVGEVVRAEPFGEVELVIADLFADDDEG